MIGALLYLHFTSLKNAARQRFLRLKNPRYLFGAIAGAVYFYFFIARHFFISPPGLDLPNADADPSQWIGLIEPLAGFVLLGLLTLSWILPSGRAALNFTEAEVAFLFPAPISRRTLIHFKLLRGQFSILITSLVLSLLSRRWAFLGGSLWIHAVGWWLIFSFINLHLIGASFTCDRLATLGLTPARRRLLLLGIVAAIGFVAAGWIRAHLPFGDEDKVTGVATILRYVNHLLEAPPLPWLSWPFRLIVRPFLATTLPSFLAGLWPVLLLIAAQYVWVIYSEVAFEEASLLQAKKRADRLAGVRSANPVARAASATAQREPFRLEPRGSPVLGFLWVNLIAIGSWCYPRTWLIVTAVLLGCEKWLLSHPLYHPFVQIIAAASAGIGVYALLLGPMIVRRAAQRTLQRLDEMKAYPLHGWEVILGELLSPIVLLSAAEWILLALLAVAAVNGVANRALSPLLAGVGSVGLALIIPPLVGILFGLNFVGNLYFPAWSVSTQPGPGIEKMGQRLIFFGGYVIVLVVCLAPALGMGALVFLLTGLLSESRALGVGLTAVGMASVLALEFAAMVWWLGGRYERFDVSAELPR